MAQTIDPADLRARAREAVRRANDEVARGLPGGTKLRAIKHLRDFYGGGLLGPYAVVVDETIAAIGDETTRERLARHLYARYGIGGWTWDEMDEGSRGRMLAQADEVLAVIAGNPTAT